MSQYDDDYTGDFHPNEAVRPGKTPASQIDKSKKIKELEKMKASTPVALAVMCEKSGKLTALSECAKCNFGAKAEITQKVGVNKVEEYTTGQMFHCDFNPRFHTRDKNFYHKPGTYMINIQAVNEKLDFIIDMLQNGGGITGQILDQVQKTGAALVHVSQNQADFYNAMNNKLDLYAPKQGVGMPNPDTRSRRPEGVTIPSTRTTKTTTTAYGQSADVINIVDPKGLCFDMPFEEYMEMLNTLNMSAMEIIMSGKDTPQRIKIEISREKRKPVKGECNCPACQIKRMMKNAGANQPSEEERKAKWREERKAKWREERKAKWREEVAKWREEVARNNTKRRAAIDLAKKVIAEIMRYTVGDKTIQVEVDRESRKVTAKLLQRTPMGTAIAGTATATCAPADTFNSYIGQAIALMRLLGLTEGPNKATYRQLIFAPQPWLTSENINTTEFRGAVYLPKNADRVGFQLGYWPVEPQFARTAIIVDDTCDPYTYDTGKLSWRKSRADILNAHRQAAITPA